MACRQLGLHDGSLDNKTLTGFLPVVVAALICNGTEMRLQDCRLHLLQSQQQQPTAAATMTNDCNNLETVGIVCSPDSCKHTRSSISKSPFNVPLKELPAKKPGKLKHKMCRPHSLYVGRPDGEGRLQPTLISQG